MNNQLFSALLAPLLPLVPPTLFTDPVGTDADDPAIVSRGEQTLILGTDKEAAPAGGLVVFNLTGKTVFRMAPLDRPNNVDVLPGFKFGKESGDLAVVTERLQRRLRLFKIGASGTLTDVTGISATFPTWSVTDQEPMGIAVARQGEKFWAFVSPKVGPKADHLEAGELLWNPATNRVDYRPSRYFGFFSGAKETESVVTDAESNRVFYSDEKVGIWANRMSDGFPLAFITNPHHAGDHEGLAIWSHPNGKRYLVASDQRERENVFWLYDLADYRRVGGFRAPVDDTDGIEIHASPMGSKFPQGILVAMNSKDKNFAIFDLRDLTNALGLGSR